MAINTRDKSPGTIASVLYRAFIPALVTATVVFKQNPPGLVVVQTTDFTVAHLNSIEYTFVAGDGIGFTATLEGSEDNVIWVTMTTLDVSKTGSISSNYNYLRVDVSVAGVLGTETSLVITGDRF